MGGIPRKSNFLLLLLIFKSGGLFYLLYWKKKFPSPFDFSMLKRKLFICSQFYQVLGMIHVLSHPWPRWLPTHPLLHIPQFCLIAGPLLIFSELSFVSFSIIPLPTLLLPKLFVLGLISQTDQKKYIHLKTLKKKKNRRMFILLCTSLCSSCEKPSRSPWFSLL